MYLRIVLENSWSPTKGMIYAQLHSVSVLKLFLDLGFFFMFLFDSVQTNLSLESVLVTT